MWIQLTGSDGQTIAFNSRHVVLLKEHGDKTLVVHKSGADIVLESRSAIFDALRLEAVERPTTSRHTLLNLDS